MRHVVIDGPRSVTVAEAPDAVLPGPDGGLRPVPELLDEALKIASRHAAELGCEVRSAHPATQLKQEQERYLSSGGHCRPAFEASSPQP